MMSGVCGHGVTCTHEKVPQNPRRATSSVISLRSSGRSAGQGVPWRSIRYGGKAERKRDELHKIPSVHLFTPLSSTPKQKTAPETMRVLRSASLSRRVTRGMRPILGRKTVSPSNIKHFYLETDLAAIAIRKASTVVSMAPTKGTIGRG